MKKKIRSFWNSRAKKKLLAGSNTVLPDLLETNYLIKLIKTVSFKGSSFEVTSLRSSKTLKKP